MNRTFAWAVFVGVAGAALVFSGCSTLSNIPKGPEGYKVVAQSDSHVPKWLNGIGRWSRGSHRKDAKWFAASSPLENSLQGAKHDAFIRAQRKASDRIGDQNWNLVGNSVKRVLNADTQTMMRIKDATTTQVRQTSQGWLVGGEEYQYYWLEYQPKDPSLVPPDHRTLYRAWALVRYSIPNWECSRRNSLKMLPMIASNLGGTLEYKNFDPAKFTQVVKDITDQNLSLIPENVCTGG
jgi:hypothetical protein